MEEGIKTERIPELSEEISRLFGCRKPDVRTYSPLALAYIGDAVYDLVIRTAVVEKANRPAHELHRLAVKYVKAESQAVMAEKLQEELTEEEQGIFRRGCNAKSSNSAKNASPQEYRKATGFEALIGYLYLSGQTDRVLYLVKLGIELSGLQL